MIKEIHFIDEAKKHFQKTEDEKLVVFDIDMVLTHCENPAFQMSNMHEHRFLARALTESLSAEQRDLFINLMIVKSDLMLIEDHVPKIIAGLQKQGTKTIALTGALAGSLLAVQDMVKWRFDSLQSFGIDFSSAFPEKPEILFHHFPKHFRSFPKFYRGILFTNGGVGLADKGKVLISFLKQVNWIPKQVVFLDDRRDNLAIVEKSLTDFDPEITFIGLHYKGAFHYPSEAISAEAFEQAWQDLLQTMRQELMVFEGA